MHDFCANIFAPIIFKAKINLEKLSEALSYKKIARKMLMKLATGKQSSFDPRG